MIPVRRLPTDPQPDERMQVLVPGLFGIGFVISLFVLAGDALSHLLPASGGRARAAARRDAIGRASDITAVRSGRHPEPGVVVRVARSRIGSLSLAALAGALAAASIVGGFAVAARVGVDRQGWALGAGFVVAVPVGLFALTWMLSGAFGSRAPRWLCYLNGFWPFGTYPDPDPQEA